MVPKCYVPPQRGVVGHENVIADDAVVPDVDTNHEEAIRTDGGDAPAHSRPAVHSHMLTDQVSRPDYEARRLASEAGMLGGGTQYSKLVDGAARSDLFGALDDDVRADIHVLGQGHIEPQ